VSAHTDFLRILTNIKDALTDVEGECALDPQPCRAGVYPAGEVPLDACGTSCDDAEGMLWVNLQPTALPNAGVNEGCVRIRVTGQIGVTRCSAAPGRDGIPDVGAIEGNAVQQALDADAIANAVLCCPAIEQADRWKLSLLSWTPIDNQGTCYGGFWTVMGAYDVCCG